MFYLLSESCIWYPLTLAFSTFLRNLYFLQSTESESVLFRGLNVFWFYSCNLPPIEFEALDAKESYPRQSLFLKETDQNFLLY